MQAAPQAHLERWQLRQDGEPWAGWTSRVWPVRGPEGACWVLKVPNAEEPAGGEGAASLAGVRRRPRALIMPTCAPTESWLDRSTDCAR